MNFFNRLRSPISSLLSRRAAAAASSSSLRSIAQTPSPLRSPVIPPNFLPSRTYSFYRSRSQPEVYHFRRRSGPRWYHDPRNVVVVAVFTGGAFVVIYFGNLETVPYTKRKHLVLLSSNMERKLGETQFQQVKATYKGKILPPLHPDSVRVRMISSQIVKAVQRGLKHDEINWSDADYSEFIMNEPSSESKDNTNFQLHSSVKKEVDLNDGWKSEEILDDKWVRESRKARKGRGHEVATKHLDGLNWEVVVVRDDAVNAFCMPGGKIMVNTGLLDNFGTDPEIATVIGHEVGHAIARHSAESITTNLWFAALQLIVLQFVFMPDLIGTLSNLLLHLPFSRRMEVEADHIGIMLLAAAGYDPRIAPRVYEKLGKVNGDSVLNNYLSTHPSSKKRAELLLRSQVMDEALAVYRDAIAGSQAEGFL